MTLTELCQCLRNWFNRKPDGGDLPKLSGDFTISGGALQVSGIAEDQYYRILGSLRNDGVHKYGDALKDETFSGDIWLMAIPDEVIALASDISAWQDKYEAADSASMSPFNSESYDGYSYTKSGSGANGSGLNTVSWQSAFASRLNMWRKI